MKFNRLLPIAMVGLAFASSSCIDDKYDLSDIDTTTRISVNDLVVPINIDKIYLKSIIDINDSDPNNHIKIIDNAYAYVQSGDFSTGAINVQAVTINSAKTSSVNINIPVTVPSVPDGTLKDISLTLPIPAEQTDYAFNANNVSDDICGLDVVNGDCQVQISVKINGLGKMKAEYEFSDFRLKVPEGLVFTECEGCKYDAATSSLIVNTKLSQPEISIKCKASSLKLTADQFNEASHSINVAGNVGIIGGSLNLHILDPVLSELKSIGLSVDYTFGKMNVTSVDGTLKYTINDVNVPEINITDLPDVLAQPGTNLVLTNPCLYLSVNNPLYICGAYAQTGFDITSYHGSNTSKYSIDKPYFTIDAKAVDNFCFSPKMPANTDADFANCQHVPFTQLSDVLSGDGLPDKLKVDLVNPNVPRQQIKGFLLGHNYGNIKGEYKFVAPLQFNGGTNITYTDKIDGWSSDDLEKMTITHLEVNVVVSTDIPVAIDFTGNPINKAGNKISGVTIEGAKIDANAQNQAVKIIVNGTISDLDGIEFVAKAAASADGKALSPDMQITLTDIRPCVSGYYQTEL